MGGAGSREGAVPVGPCPGCRDCGAYRLALSLPPPLSPHAVWVKFWGSKQQPELVRPRLCLCMPPYPPHVSGTCLHYSLHVGASMCSHSELLPSLMGSHLSIRVTGRRHGIQSSGLP